MTSDVTPGRRNRKELANAHTGNVGRKPAEPYQPVKLFGATLKKAVRNRVESRGMKCGMFGIVMPCGLAWFWCG